MIAVGRYTSGRIAVANLSSSIESLELRRVEGATFEELVELSKCCFFAATCSVVSRTMTAPKASPTRLLQSSPDTARALYIRARLAERFHRFQEAHALLDEALAAGHPEHEIDITRAALFQATGKYSAALVLRERLANDDRGIQTLGALASLLAEMGQWAAAESCYAAALDEDDHVSPLPCGQLLFEFGVSAMRRGDLRPCGAALRGARRNSADARSGRADIAQRSRSRADSWTSLQRSSHRYSNSPTILSIAGSMQRSWRRVVNAKRQ